MECLGFISVITTFRECWGLGLMPRAIRGGGRDRREGEKRPIASDLEVFYSCLCRCVPVLMEARDWHWGLPRVFATLLFETGLTLQQELTNFARLTDQWVPGIPLQSLPSAGTASVCYWIQLFLCGFWGSRPKGLSYSSLTVIKYHDNL